MTLHNHILGILLTALVLAPEAFTKEPADTRTLSVTVGKSVLVDSEANITRVAIAGSALAESVAINQRELLVNGLMPGETSMVIWQEDGGRVIYNLSVLPNAGKLEAVRQELAEEAQGATITLEGDTAFLRGTVRDTITAERAVTIAGTMGKVVNLLYVTVPPADAQVLLKVRFANVERNASAQLGVDLMSTGHLNTTGATSTGEISLSDALNLLVFRKTFNLSATLTALQNNNLAEILAEPNLLAIDGKPASFVAGGEYPYPTVQGGSAAGAVTVAFREFGVSIKFLPTVTPRGGIRLHVTPEVSSLDFANGLIVQGFRVPALVSRRVDTDVELESGQSFAIAGLLDNRVTETLSKVPGIGDIPVLGKLFQNKTRSTSNSELLIIITPEIVQPIAADATLPDLQRPVPFLKGAPQDLPRTPGTASPLPVPTPAALPAEQLQKVKEVQRSTLSTGPQGQTSLERSTN